MLCPRCFTGMEVLRVGEARGGATVVEVVARCPRCRYRIVVERIEIRRDGSELVIHRRARNEYVSPRSG